MRQRYREMQDAADALIDRQQFLHRDGQIHIARNDVLKRVRDNSFPNTPDKDLARAEISTMFNSRRRGA